MAQLTACPVCARPMDASRMMCPLCEQTSGEATIISGNPAASPYERTIVQPQQLPARHQRACGVCGSPLLPTDTSCTFCTYNRDVRSDRAYWARTGAIVLGIACAAGVLLWQMGTPSQSPPEQRGSALPAAMATPDQALPHPPFAGEPSYSQPSVPTPSAVGAPREERPVPANPDPSTINQAQTAVEQKQNDLRLLSEENNDLGAFGWHIKGIVENASDREYSLVAIEYNIYDAAGNQIGTASDQIAHLEPHGRWKFNAEVPASEHGAASFKLKELTGF